MSPDCRITRCPMPLVAAAVLAFGLLSCSSVPRFTRPDSLPPILSKTTVHVESASPAQQPPDAGDLRAGNVWRTSVSWYGEGMQGMSTASGEPYRLEALSAAHRELPFGTWLQVENLANGKKIEVRVNDRGPFKEGRDLDLSREAARRLGFLEAGTTQVEVRVLTLP